MMMKVGHFSQKNRSFVPTQDHSVFQDTLIIHLLMSLESARRIRMRPALGHTVVKTMCARIILTLRNFMNI